MNGETRDNVLTDRGHQTKRVLTIAIMLSSRGYKLMDIAAKFGCSKKTVYRDIRLLEDMNIPVYQEEADMDLASGSEVKLWRIDKHWLSKFVQEVPCTVASRSE